MMMKEKVGEVFSIAMDMIVFLRLVVVERRDTFHVVPLLELLRELPQHLVGIKLRVFLRQSND